MPVKKTELYIARKISSRGSSDGRNVMVRIAVWTAAVSTAVMIIALAVIMGFRKTITQRLTGIGGEIQVVRLDGNASFETKPILRNQPLEASIQGLAEVEDIKAYAVKGGILKTSDAINGIMLKGYDDAGAFDFFRDHLTDGTLPVITDSVRKKDILISGLISRETGLGTGDRVEIMFIGQDGPPRRDRFSVSGIYDTGFEELDRILIPTDIRNVQRLNGWTPDQITGYEISNDGRNSGNLAGEVYRTVLATPLAEGEVLMVTDVRDRFAGLFDWLSAHNVNAAVIITIMIIVTLLNMTSALLIILLGRTSMIGLLKSLGMTNGSVRKIFIYRSAGILLTGMFWGNVAGIAICLLQKYTGLIKLDSAGYLLSEVPVSISVPWLILLNAGIFLVILAFLILPTTVISRIMPDQTLRYQ